MLRFAVLYIALNIGIVSSGFANEEKAKSILVFDFLSQRSEETESKSSAGTKKEKATELKTIRPGSVQLGILSKDWGFLMDIAPDSGKTGLVAGGLSVAMGQYVGIALNLNNRKVEGGDDSKAEFYGLMGYHMLPGGSYGMFSVLWALGQVNGKGLADPLSSGTPIPYKTKGTSALIRFRYNLKIAENVQYSPGIFFETKSLENDFSAFKIDQSITATTLVPIAVTLLF